MFCYFHLRNRLTSMSAPSFQAAKPTAQEKALVSVSHHLSKFVISFDSKMVKFLKHLGGVVPFLPYKLRTSFAKLCCDFTLVGSGGPGDRWVHTPQEGTYIAGLAGLRLLWLLKTQEKYKPLTGKMGTFL